MRKGSGLSQFMAPVWVRKRSICRPKDFWLFLNPKSLKNFCFDWLGSSSGLGKTTDSVLVARIKWPGHRLISMIRAGIEAFEELENFQSRGFQCELAKHAGFLVSNHFEDDMEAVTHLIEQELLAKPVLVPTFPPMSQTGANQRDAVFAELADDGIEVAPSRIMVFTMWRRLSDRRSTLRRW
jgi:hypothetical protein